MTDIKKLQSFRCPGWDSLPEIELYMDQVLTLTSKYFGIFSDNPDGIITSSMINNYVKASVMPAPHKKRYGREHIAYIFMICVLKRVLSINQTGALIELLRGEKDIKAVYDLFRSELDRSVAYIGATLSKKHDVRAPETDGTDAELALRCAVGAFSNAVLADLLLGGENTKEKEKE